MAVATKAGKKANAKPTEKGTTARRLVELVVRSDDEKGQPFSSLVPTLTGNGFEVSRGSRGARKDGRVIYSVTVTGDKK